MPDYHAPPLNRRVMVRNPDPTGPSSQSATASALRRTMRTVWGVEVWAARRDLAPRQSVEEAVLVEVLRSIFTIRHRWRRGA